ncbi:MAG: NAD-glutamate dehydrogenase, partial [Rhodospirillaceae bacterium]|nr:NAD-glutamate dehydrogenase [Rhodospirillaceae bacterium]
MLVERFARAYYAQLSLDDLQTSDPSALAASAHSLFKFSATRKPKASLIRVFNSASEKVSKRHPVRTIIEIITDDMPFIVDSVMAELNRHDVLVHLIAHPVIPVSRTATGRLKDVAINAAAAGDDGGFSPESYIHIEISEQTSAEIADIKTEMQNILTDVGYAVSDWRAMIARINDVLLDMETSPPPLVAEEIAEGREFLEWVRDEHFTFLGVRTYDLVRRGGKDYLQPAPKMNLGIMRRMTKESTARHSAPLSPGRSRLFRKKELLIVTKAHNRATVHRSVHMDYIGVRRFDARGRVIGEHRFLGLFSSMAYNQSPRYIPLLRRKLSRVMELAGFSAFGHDGKGFLHILETFPRDELFQVSERELLEISLGILRLEERRRVALFLRRDQLEQFVSCLVYVPNDRYSTDIAHKFQTILAENLDGEINSFSTQVSDAPLARLHYTFKLKPADEAPKKAKAIEALLVAASRSWDDQLLQALIKERGEKSALDLHRKYGTGFSAAYRETFSPQTALSDIDLIEEIDRGKNGRGSEKFALNLYRPVGAQAHELRLKIAHLNGSPIAPSDVLPMMENMGLRVVRDIPYGVELTVGDGSAEAVAPHAWIHDFTMMTSDSNDVDLAASKEKFEAAFARIWTRDVEDDGFNRLVFRAGLTWREIVVLRAYCKYLGQINIPFSEAYMQDALVGNPELACLLVDLFHARCDPSLGVAAARKMVRASVDIEGRLEDVANLDEDRIIRRYYNLIRATLRTNYYQEEPEGGPKSYLSFKLDSLAVDDLPLPRPMYEIFVYSPRVEGIHLRGGKVARGGLRWSDRREDFRTEILGLMKAQMVKNTVIVPVGSKGGFVVKRPPSPLLGREGFMKEGIECYKILIRGLLDLTDNLKGSRVTPPKQVMRHDSDDTYLVVAADKGTATFSDIANGVAIEHGFWLGDAFASGGSVGYDHKKMGITAKGAWESVKRHFRERGLNIQKQDFTTIGVGDMAGDVFGNGMLLSRHIRLVGAFNHMHIFIDPEPDAAKSFVERKRLFNLARSSWSDYRTQLISKGGGIFERSAKSIALSPQAKKLFGLSRENVTPAELIRAMLSSQVDLLWFGGIGTYLKASNESDAEVGDHANDAVRIDARDVRAHVIGEGANLGVTQRARVEYAISGCAGEGGRINTDAIDNSAGVDCSDHEVNIKIAVDQLIAAKKTSHKKREKLLAEMTDEVGMLVLRDNYWQTQAITIGLARGRGGFDRYVRLMQALERSGRLNRQVEFLPDDEALADRRASGQTLTRPEIAVLLGYAKLELYDRLLDSDLADDALLMRDMVRYFPTRLRDKYPDILMSHRLNREIVATRLTNSLINRAGISFIQDMGEKTGRSEADIARAYSIVRDVFGMLTLWSDIEALDNKVPAAVQTEMHIATQDLITQGSLWLLRHCPRALNITKTCAEFAAGIAALIACLDKVLSESDRAAFDQRRLTFSSQGVPDDLAHHIAALD